MNKSAFTLAVFLLFTFPVLTFARQNERENSRLLPVRKNGKWGAIDQKGNIILPPIYDRLGDFDSENRATVTENNLFGLIDSTGRFLVPVQYEEVRRADSKNAVVFKERKAALFRLADQKELTDFLYDHIRPAICNYGPEQINFDYQLTENQSFETKYFLTIKDKKQGLIDFTGRLICQPVYDEITPFRNACFLVRSGEFYGLIGPDGKLIYEPIYRQISAENTELVRLIIDSKIGIGDNAGQIIIPIKHISLEDFPLLFEGESCFKIRTETGCGIISRSGKSVCFPIYQSLDYLKNQNYIISQKEEKIGLISWPDCEPAVDFEWENYHYEDSLSYLELGRKEGKAIFVFSLGRLFRFPYYEEIHRLSQSLFLIRNQNKFRLFDLEQSNILPTVFYALRRLGPEIFGLQTEYKKNSWVLVDSSGRSLSGTVFNRLYRFPKNMSLTKAGTPSGLGLIGRNGKLIVPAVYDKISLYSQSAKAYRGEKVTLYEFSAAGQLTSEMTFKKFKSLKINEFEKPEVDVEFREDDDPLRRQGRSQLANSSRNNGRWLGSRTQSSANGFRFLQTGNDGILIWPSDKRKEFPVSSVEVNDFTSASVARAYKNRFGQGKGNYAFVKKNGEFVQSFRIEEKGRKEFKLIGFMGPFSEGVFRLNVGGETGNPNSRFLGDTILNECIGGKWAFVDSKGEPVGEFEFDYLSDLYHNRALAKMGEKWGIVDGTGKVILGFNYDWISWLPGSDRKCFVLGDLTLRYGFTDREGNTVIEADYEDIRPFSEDLAAARLDGKWGFIDKNGRPVSGFHYENVQDFSEGLAPASVRKSGGIVRWGFIDRQGNWAVEPEYIAARPFTEGLAAVRRQRYFAFINPAGEELISEKFTEAEPFREGLAKVRFKRKFGLIDTGGRFVIPAKYTFIGQFDAQGLAVARKKSRNAGLLDRSGRAILPFHYSEIGDFSEEGLAAVRHRRKNKYGFADTSGQLIIPAKYAGAGDFKDGLAKVQIERNGKWGFLRPDGSFALPVIYGHAGDFSEGFVRISDTFRSEKYFIDKTGEHRFAEQFNDALSDFSENRAAVKAFSGRLFFTDSSKRAVTPEIYTQTSGFSAGRALVRSAEGWGMIDEKGRAVGRQNFSRFEVSEAGLFKIGVNPVYGLCDLNGKMIAPMGAEELEKTAENLYRIRKGDRIGYVFSDGRALWELQK